MTTVDLKEIDASKLGPGTWFVVRREVHIGTKWNGRILVMLDNGEACDPTTGEVFEGSSLAIAKALPLKGVSIEVKP